LVPWRRSWWVLKSFFFSSRRRHTRSKRDWSSDVCSSDLLQVGKILTPWGNSLHNGVLAHLEVGQSGSASGTFEGNVAFMWVRNRSEERRVGKECRWWWWT